MHAYASQASLLTSIWSGAPNPQGSKRRLRGGAFGRPFRPVDRALEELLCSPSCCALPYSHHEARPYAPACKAVRCAAYRAGYAGIPASVSRAGAHAGAIEPPVPVRIGGLPQAPLTRAAERRCAPMSASTQSTAQGHFLLQLTGD